MSPPTSENVHASVLLADISGSTSLFQTVDDAEAQRLIGRELERLRTAISDQGGIYIREKGDDVLAYFHDPSDALRCALQVIANPSDHLLAVHAGLHFGQILCAEDDIFGEPVNLTARLAAMANAGEALLSQSFCDRLPDHKTTGLQPIDHVWLKGISEPVNIYSLIDEDTAMRTRMILGSGNAGPPGTAWARVSEVTLILTYDHGLQRCREAGGVLIGRSSECDLVLGSPWVSRKHALVTVREGKVIFEDRSSSGTYLTINDGHEFFVRRETVVLSGSGMISPAVSNDQPEADRIRFEIIQR
ncbi:MAG: FHA domain-containing protein [Geminicoccaceae bacterium]